MTAAAENKEGEGIPKLWAGKYQTPEEMETALKAKDTEAHKLFETNKTLAAQIANANTAPEHYDVPKDAADLPDLDNVKSMAKAATLSQEAFNKLVQERVNSHKGYLAKIETAKKDVGDENMILLDEYVKKNYPATMHKSTLDELVLNPTARQEALAHREKNLSSRTPGMNNGNAGADDKPKYDGQEEVAKRAEEWLKKPSDAKRREKLIETAREVGQARYGKK